MPGRLEHFGHLLHDGMRRLKLERVHRQPVGTHGAASRESGWQERTGDSNRLVTRQAGFGCSAGAFWVSV